MADQKITELPIKTSAQMNLTDYLLGIDSAEGYQMLVSDIAKKIVEDYAGSTLLGTAQSVQNAINTIPNAACMINSTYYTTIPNESDLDTYVTTGVYGVSSNAAAKSLVNCPVEQSFKMIVEDRTTTASETGNYRYKWQRLYPLNTTDVYVRRLSTSNGGATWTIVPQEWEKQPTRAEMNKITDITGIFNTDLFTAGSSTQQYNVPNNSQHLVILQAASRTAHGIYLVSVTSSGIMQLTEVIKGENITVTAPSANTLEIVNAYTNACYFNDICLRGSAITKVTASTNSAQSESI